MLVIFIVRKNLNLQEFDTNSHRSIHFKNWSSRWISSSKLLRKNFVLDHLNRNNLSQPWQGCKVDFMLSLRLLKSKNHTGHCVPISSGRKWCGGRWNNDRTPVADGTTVGDDQDGGANFLNFFVSTTVLYLGGRKKVQVTNKFQTFS